MVKEGSDPGGTFSLEESRAGRASNPIFADRRPGAEVSFSE
jgi:hypothetical protein